MVSKLTVSVENSNRKSGEVLNSSFLQPEIKNAIRRNRKREGYMKRVIRFSTRVITPLNGAILQFWAGFFPG
jgi:hypothetical protein